MRIFECQNCGQPLYFENTHCESCGLRLGYLPEQATITALKEGDGVWHALAEPEGTYRHCGNAVHEVCNWLVPAEQPGQFCVGLPPQPHHPRSVGPGKSPALAQDRGRQAPAVLHAAQVSPAARHQGRGAGRSGVRLHRRPDRPAGSHPGPDRPRQTASSPSTSRRPTIPSASAGAARWASPTARCSAISATRSRITTGTAWWRSRRAWRNSARCSATSSGITARRLQQHYANGPPADWPERFVSSYASSHPWEDFAETWAHYLHMIDTLETASAFGLSVRPKVGNPGEMSAKIDFEPYGADMGRIIDAWLPLTYAMNSINRSMGLQDFYPFVLKPAGDRQAHVHSPAHASAGGRDPAGGRARSAPRHRGRAAAQDRPAGLTASGIDPSVVIAGLDPAIHPCRGSFSMDARVKPGHDNTNACYRRPGICMTNRQVWAAAASRVSLRAAVQGDQRVGV